MSLLLATLLPGILLIVFGSVLLLDNPVVASVAKAIPRSKAAALVFFGGASLWFLFVVGRMGEADRILGSSNGPWVLGFAALAVLSFMYVPDFLPVRGLSMLILLAAWPLLRAAYMEYGHPQRLFMVSLVFAAIVAAIYLAAVPYRLRDFLQWLFDQPKRARLSGAGLLLYGLLLSIIAFTY